MKALRKLAPGPGATALEQVTEPVAGPGQALVEVRAAGICGTDLHILAGDYPTATPVTIGHEGAGVVAAVGAGVDSSWEGAEVTVETYFSTCGRCRECRAGLPNLCRSRRSIGTHVDGVFAERVVVPAANLRRLPDGVGLAEGALTEPLACVCNSLAGPVRIQPGDEAMVAGPGAIGLMAAQVARAAGARVTLFGLPDDAARLAVAERLGFETETGPPDEQRYAVAIECSGSGGGLRSCLAGARRAGGLIAIGLAGRDVTLPFDEVALKQLTVAGSLASVPSSWDAAQALMASGAVELAPLLGELAPLHAWEDAFEAARSGRAVKVAFDPAA